MQDTRPRSAYSWEQVEPNSGVGIFQSPSVPSEEDSSRSWTVSTADDIAFKVGGAIEVAVKG